MSEIRGPDRPATPRRGWVLKLRRSALRPARSPHPEPKGFGSVLGVVVVSLVVGYLLGGKAGPVLHNRMLPWILGRSLGIASYLSLVALVAMGLWFRHPWRPRRRQPVHPAAVLRGHVALAVTTGALVLGHILVLAADSFAGVGWVGAVVPGEARYRPAAVALGIVGLYGGIVVVITVLLAGSVARRVWLPVHRVAGLSLVLVWFHGVLAGTDTVALRALYAGTGVVLMAMAVTRYLPRPVRMDPTHGGVGPSPHGDEEPLVNPAPRCSPDSSPSGDVAMSHVP